MNAFTMSGLALVVVSFIIWRLWAVPQYHGHRAHQLAHGRPAPSAPSTGRSLVLLVAGICTAGLFALVGLVIAWLDRALTARPL